MMDVAANQATSLGSVAGVARRWVPSPLLCLVAPALSLGLFGRLYIDWSAPLWVDESFTAAIAGSRSLHRLFEWCIQDPNAPLYYAFIWVWSHIFGGAALSLRLPSAIFSVAAPLLAAWKGHEDRDIRLFWGVLLALWVPIWGYAPEARCYSLLFLLATLQAILFMRVVEGSSRRTVWLWTIASASLCLTHYYAIFPTALQVLMLFACDPKKIFRNIAACLPFLAAAAWFAIHVASLARFTNANTSWYQLMTLGRAVGVFDLLFIMGPKALIWVFLATTGYQILRFMIGESPWRYSASETMVAISGFGALLIVVCIAFFKPVFSERYMIPMVPAALLAIALWARRMFGSSRIPMLILIGVWSSTALAMIHVRDPGAMATQNGYNLERPADWLRTKGLRRLVFYWGHPSAVLYDRGLLADVGAESLRRSGWHGPVVGLTRDGLDADPAPVLAAAASRSGDGFLWADRFAKSGGDPNAVPAVLKDTRIWDCRTFGRDSVPVLACIRQ